MLNKKRKQKMNIREESKARMLSESFKDEKQKHSECAYIGNDGTKQRLSGYARVCMHMICAYHDPR